MNPILNRNLFFVKEHVGMFKASNSYDVLDPETKEIILNCREDNMSFFTKMLRFTDYKRMTPFLVTVKTPQGATVLSVKRGWTFFRSVVEVMDDNGQLVGTFRQRMLSIGGKFDLLAPDGSLLCTLKGKWTSWDFSFEKDGQTFARVNKKWAGLGKELFTTADNYMLGIEESVAPNHPMRIMIMAAVMCIDMVLKE
jgi:uncharacterized protein YxjI